MNRKMRTEFFAKLKKANPSPKTELIYSSNYQLLIAVMLSAQATDISVNKATEILFRNAPDPKAMVDLGEVEVRKYIKTIGLFNTKAKNVVRTSQILLTKYNGAVPNQRAELEALPGVGRKTANVILNTAFGEPTIAVDTHIFRVSNRTNLARGKTPLEVEKRLLQAVPEKFMKNAHHWLILLGRYTCTARKPKCGSCLVVEYCKWKLKSDYMAG
jgi:endonuclease-3